MRILVAPDSFKEDLTAQEVANNLQQGLKAASSELEVATLPLADGGEGTVKSLVTATDGRIVEQSVVGPLGTQLEACFGILGEGETAVIEMAAASGLSLVPKAKRNPMQTTTYGTGQLIKAALDQGCSKLIIGIGGSATNDCGVGMAQALGGKFLTESGENVDWGGGNLERITEIDLSGLEARLAEVEIEVACDVNNPLSGKQGAAYVYAPQKGATPAQVKKLEAGLKNIAEVIERDLDLAVDEIPGAGAAGGLGAGLLAFLGAKLRPGIEIVSEAVNLKEKIRSFDLVITGEGQIDAQTAAGKVPAGVAKVAGATPVIGVAGSLAQGAEAAYESGITALFSILNRPMGLEKAVEDSELLLQQFGKNLGRLLISTQLA